jgi:hypothetical protein
MLIVVALASFFLPFFLEIRLLRFRRMKKGYGGVGPADILVKCERSRLNQQRDMEARSDEVGLLLYTYSTGSGRVTAF